MDTGSVAVEMRNIVKKFGDFTANDHINLLVHKGEVHAILGENGAGKSTLMNVLYGLYRPTSGQIFIDGKEVQISSPKHAIELGIGMVHQHFMLIQPFTVTENIILGVEPRKGLKVDIKSARQKVVELSERYGMKVDPDAKIEDISVGMQQRVEILKVLYRGANTLILDEPTVGLDPSQIIEMRELIRELSKNHTVLLSSHIMQEISAVCDEIIIINEGKMITKDTPENITKKMVDTNGVHVVVKGDKTKLKEALRTISGIKNVSYDNDKDTEEDTTGLTIYCAEDEDIRVDLFYALAKAECPLIEMNKLDTSLEDAFLALTRGGSKQYGGRKLKKLKSEKKDKAETEGELQNENENQNSEKNADISGELDVSETEKHSSDMEGGEK